MPIPLLILSDSVTSTSGLGRITRDLALRLASCGIRGVQLDMQYYHYGSASHRLAPPESGAAQRTQADADRIYFEKKWGFRVDSLEYGQRPADPNFRG